MLFSSMVVGKVLLPKVTIKRPMFILPLQGEGVFQKNYKWYVRKFVGKINGESMFKNDEFHSGYKFSEV